MDDIDPEKALAALEQLEAEKERRLQAKIDSGEVVSVQTTVIVGPDESIEDAKARALAGHPVSDDGRTGHREFFFIFTGVPRDPDSANRKEENSSPQAETSASSEGPSHPSEEPARSDQPFTRSEPTYVRVTIRNGDDDGDPGAIAEAYYTVEAGMVVLTDLNDKPITSRALARGEDPAALARSLLRERRQPEFSRPIKYPNLGIA